MHRSLINTLMLLTTIEHKNKYMAYAINYSMPSSLVTWTFDEAYARRIGCCSLRRNRVSAGRTASTVFDWSDGDRRRLAGRPPLSFSASSSTLRSSDESRSACRSRHHRRRRRRHSVWLPGCCRGSWPAGGWKYERRRHCLRKIFTPINGWFGTVIEDR